MSEKKLLDELTETQPSQKQIDIFEKQLMKH